MAPTGTTEASGTGTAGDATDKERIKRLERENALLRIERDILKNDRVRRTDAQVASSTEESYRFIAEHAHEYPLEVLCQMLGVSRSGYHAWAGRPESRRQISDAELLVLIRELFIEHKRRFGAPRRTSALLAQKKLRVNHKRVARLMRAHGLVARSAPRRRISTTDC